MELGYTDTTIELDAQSFKKGSIRPFYTGNNVEIIFPWYNNQKLYDGDYSGLTIDGNPASSVAQVKAYINDHFYS